MNEPAQPAASHTPPVPVATGAMIRMTDVTRTYDTGSAEIRAVNGVSLQIEPGSSVALMGPSGSGKSTLLHLIGAMDRPTSGTIEVGDTHVESLTGDDAADYRRTVGFVFQRFHLLPALSVLDNVLAPLIPLKLDSDPEPRARDLIAAVGLQNREHAVPGQLSGGQQQRVAIARGLINNPQVLIADEPTGNLDTITGQEVLTLLLSMCTEHGTTLVIATHDTNIAAQCDRTIHITDGVLTTTP